MKNKKEIVEAPKTEAPKTEAPNTAKGLAVLKKDGKFTMLAITIADDGTYVVDDSQTTLAVHYMTDDAIRRLRTLVDEL